MKSILSLVLACGALALTACEVDSTTDDASGNGSSAPSVGGTDPDLESPVEVPASDGEGRSLPPFSGAYCVGVLLRELPRLETSGSEAWMLGSGKAPPGTPVLLSGWGQWGQAFFVQEGSIFAVWPETVGDPLVRDVDFLSPCVAEPSFAATELVLLRDASIYPGPDGAGSPCHLPAGTPLHGASEQVGMDYTLGDAERLVAADEIEATCGFRKGYSSDFLEAGLVRR